MSQATEELWRSYSDDLLRYIRRRVSDEATAEDLRQDVFLQMQRHLPSLRDDERIAGWMYRIARNRIVDHYRGQRPNERLNHEVPGEEEEARELNYIAGSWLRARIEELPEPYRETMRLVELEGKSQTEVAALLGLSVSGAKSRVQRGRSMLRESLDECCRIERDRRGNIIEMQPHKCC
jgi:RNA polymerase sigma-70 factor (ECF subfamily)